LPAQLCLPPRPWRSRHNTAVDYDFEAAARQAEAVGRDAVAYSLRTWRLPAV